MGESEAAKERSALRDMFQRSRRGELVAIAASGLAGLLSLAVATYNVYLQRAQVRAQVWPHLEWTYSNVDGFEWNVGNTGVGPARIVGVRVSRNGVAFHDWRELLESIEKKDPSFVGERRTHSTVTGRVLPAGGVIHAISFHPPDAPNTESRTKEKEQEELTSALANIKAEICYCSTLDDCWLLGGSFGSESISSCPMSELTFRD